MADLNISLLQALQLAALLPCLFVMLALLLVTRSWQKSAVPVCYFLCLSCSFIYPLLPLLGEPEAWVNGLLLAGQNLEAALCFLLIIQFSTNAVPRPVYWLILALPIIGGSSMLYAMLAVDEVCLLPEQCIPSSSAHVLYQLFSSCLILLLLIMQFSRRAVAFPAHDLQRMHKYWLVVAFILLNAVLLGSDLAMIAGNVTVKEHAMITTVIRIAFIYLVLTSLFRVFDHAVVQDAPVKISRYRDAPVSPALIQALELAMTQDTVYREMGMGRDMLSEKLGVSPHSLSKAVNQHFGKNLHEYINGYRIEEAKRRLRGEPTPVTNIAFEVGFSSIASFNRVFKSLVGQSPTEYRTAGDKA